MRTHALFHTHLEKAPVIKNPARCSEVLHVWPHTPDLLGEALNPGGRKAHCEDKRCSGLRSTRLTRCVTHSEHAAHEGICRAFHGAGICKGVAAGVPPSVADPWVCEPSRKCHPTKNRGPGWEKGALQKPAFGTNTSAEWEAHSTLGLQRAHKHTTCPRNA